MDLPFPTLFISHGAPTLALEEAPTSAFLKELAVTLPKPRAIVMVSAHWETEVPSITGVENPETVHDFYGFPEALYALRYTAPGSPVLARQVQQLLQDNGFPAIIDNDRGLDHGAWNPLLLAYPDALIPVVQLSVQPHMDALWHYRIGQALAPLRNEDVLIIGSGNLTHNLREAFRGKHAETPVWVSEFAEWIAKRLAGNNIKDLLDWENNAPYANENHPTPEHFLPFFVSLGAAGKTLHAKRLHTDTAMGVLAMDAYSFGETS